MKGDKISSFKLDQVVGGSVIGDNISISVRKGEVVLVRNGKVSYLDKISFEEGLDISIYPMSDEQFATIKSMCYGDKQYSNEDVKAATGIDLAGAIAKW